MSTLLLLLITITINYYITINTFKHIKTSNSEEHVWPRIRQHPYRCHNNNNN
jgi:hypothetical protein